MMKPGIFKHIKCRNNIYPSSSVQRFRVPDNLIFWSNGFPEYGPPFYEHPSVKGKPYADPDINDALFKPKWHLIDGNINRTSAEEYEINNGYPLNPFGRTGLIGRGLLGRWGPNHAADPIVTRWKRSSSEEFILNPVTSKKILQMVCIQRHDNKKWAIPGGMVDPGEKVSQTLKREFTEEALNSPNSKEKIDDFFSTGIEIFKGYVDDFRNTDNAWMETVACNFHDERGAVVGSLNLSAGDDATNVKWMDIDSSIDLHASHGLIIEQVVKRLDGHW